MGNLLPTPNHPRLRNWETLAGDHGHGWAGLPA